MADEQNKKKEDSKRESIGENDSFRVDNRGYKSSVSSYNDVFNFVEKSSFSRTSIYTKTSMRCYN